jgi:nucleoside-diphosphate-sugar epimerase
LKLKEDLKHILTYTGPVWKAMVGKTVFITGGTGFFGKWLLESFIYANESLVLNAKMIVLSREPDSFIEKYPHLQWPSISYIQGDIRCFEFPDEQIDYIIHAASEVDSDLNVTAPLLVYDIIVDGMRRVLELARTKKVLGFLHTSSGAVYGRQPSSLTHIPEDFTGSPDVYNAGVSYGEGKRVAEMLANIYSGKFGVNSKVARCFAFVGPYLALENPFAIGNFIKDTIEGETIVIKGDGSPYRSYMYAADLAIWLWHILVFGEKSRPYNVGSDAGLNIEELARKVASFSGNNKQTIEILTRKNAAPPARYVPSVKRAKEELHLDVYIDLDEAIKRTIAFYTL